MPLVKIAIDIRRMSEFGVGTYIRNIVRNLGRLDHETTYFLIGSAAKVKEIGALPANFHTIAIAEPERSVKSFREFREVVKRLECDLVHIPNLFSVPRYLPCPYVMTVHDMLDHLSRARQQTGFWGSLHFQLTKRSLRASSQFQTLRRSKWRSFSAFLSSASKWSTTPSTSASSTDMLPPPTGSLSPSATRSLIRSCFMPEESARTRMLCA